MKKQNKNKIIYIFAVAFLFVFGFFYKTDSQKKEQKIAEPKKGDNIKPIASNETAFSDVCDVEEDDDEYLFIGCNGFF